MSDFPIQHPTRADYLATTRTVEMLGVSARRVRVMAKTRVPRAARFGRESLVPFGEALYQTIGRGPFYDSAPT